MAKYMRHVQIVAHGRNASQMHATNTARAPKRRSENACFDSCLRRSMMGSLSGIVGEYTVLVKVNSLVFVST